MIQPTKGFHNLSPKQKDQQHGRFKRRGKFTIEQARIAAANCEYRYKKGLIM